MRTTVTLDEDVAAGLQSLARRSGRPFKDVLNETLRKGLTAASVPRRAEPFKVKTRDLGGCLPGLTFDSVADLLERVEGPHHR